jgi:hypothetical protein
MKLTVDYTLTDADGEDFDVTVRASVEFQDDAVYVGALTIRNPDGTRWKGELSEDEQEMIEQKLVETATEAELDEGADEPQELEFG